MRLDVVEPPKVLLNVTVPEPERIDVIHNRVELTVIDMEA